METEIILTPLQEIGWKIFEDLCPNMRYEIAKHLLDTKDIYIIKNVFELLNEYHRCELSKQLLDVKHFPIIKQVFSILDKEHRYNFLMDYNLKKLKNERDWNHMRNMSHLFFHYNLRNELPNYDPELDLYSESSKEAWEFICEHNERRLFDQRKNSPTNYLCPTSEERFLEEFYKTSCHILMLKKYEEEQYRNNIVKLLDRDNNFTEYDHYDWCEYGCRLNHKRELQYRCNYFDKLRQESIARAVRIAIKRFGKVFKKIYPDYKPMMDKRLFDRLYFLLYCHVKNRDIIYELELELISLANHIKFTPLANSNIYELETELIPFTDRFYQIKYLVE